MPPHPLLSRSRARRPSLEGLEARALLSRMTAPTAMVAALGNMTPRSKAVPTIDQLATAPMQTVSTVPANGDVNPYGVAFVPAGFPRGGSLNPGDVLVSNFNNVNNLQGTGSTIVRITPQGQSSVFYQGPSTGVGLTTALGVLRRGFVIVGNVPTTDGTSATIGQGSLIVLNSSGKQVANLTSPWDLAVNDMGSRAQIFVSNVLSGTVTRLNVNLPARGGVDVTSATQIASGYTHRSDPFAFEIGPTGLAYNAHTGVLYVASTLDNALYAIPHAGTTRTDRGTGTLVSQDSTHLHGPLGLALAPDGNLIAANGDAVNPDPNHPSELVEFTPRGQFVGQFSTNPSIGAPFGLAFSSTNPLRLAAVSDITNSLGIWQVKK
jgi:hypothetical protein